jgi:hypothetical protein
MLVRIKYTKENYFKHLTTSTQVESNAIIIIIIIMKNINNHTKNILTNIRSTKIMEPGGTFLPKSGKPF